MDHRQYIELYLSADADGELSVEERSAVLAHLVDCTECRGRLAAERATKALLHDALPIIPAPAALRERILAALDGADHAPLKARESRRSARVFRRPLLWTAAATALAACLIVMLANLRKREPGNPTFDSAIAAFKKSEQHFVPTVGSESPDALAIALIDQFGIAPVWDFSSIGLASVGGQIDRPPGGKAVAYALYKGSGGSLLCVIDRDHDFHFPSGGQVVKGIHIYRYKGFSIAATNRYAVFCVMVTRLPTGQLASVFDKLPA